MNIKKAIIIGASSGIGKGISLELLKKGYKIAISARRKERLDEIKKLNPDMVIVKEYDSSTETNDELIKNLIDKLNGVDLIIYCSGIGIINKELDYSLEKKVNKNFICESKTDLPDDRKCGSSAHHSRSTWKTFALATL